MATLLLKIIGNTLTKEKMAALPAKNNPMNIGEFPLNFKSLTDRCLFQIY